MEQQRARELEIVHSDEVIASQELTLAASDFETLSQAFQKFSTASMQLQTKYDEIKKESAALRAELAKKELEIKRNERLSTLGETAAALAHEIRNPLGAMSLYTSLLKEDLASQPQQQELVVAIDRSINTLNHVVGNILHFARRSSPVLAPVSLNAILNEICQQLSQVHAKALIKLRCRGSLIVWADETGMRQLFSNLIVNALQAQEASAQVHIVAAKLNGRVIVKVRDNGPGVPPESLEQIFEPFVTSKSAGTGLGLAICREIVRAHQAQIVCRNGRAGAQFVVGFKKVSGIK